MKEEMLAYLNERIGWHKQEQARLKQDDRADEAAHMQIATNVYSIFQATWQAMKYDMGVTLTRFGAIVETWNESHRKACEHSDVTKKLIEEIKINRALEIIRYAKELEGMRHD